MTVSTEYTGAVTFAGGTAVLDFTFPHKVLNDDDLIVKVITGTSEVLLVLGVGYTVTGYGPSSSSAVVTLTSAVAGGSTLSIERSTIATQDSDFINSNRFDAEAFESAFDKLTIVDQEHESRIDTLEVDLTSLEALQAQDRADIDARTIAPTPSSISGFSDAGHPVSYPVSQLLTGLGAFTKRNSIDGARALWDALPIYSTWLDDTASPFQFYWRSSATPGIWSGPERWSITDAQLSTSIGGLNIKSSPYNAKGDGIYVTGAVTIAAASAALTVVGAAFVVGDIGKTIQVPDCGVAGADLVTTIAGYTSATQVTLAATASTSLVAASKTVLYGTDDTAAFNAAKAMLDASRVSADPTYLPSRGLGRILVPRGKYIVTGSISGSSAQSLILEGEGPEASVIIYPKDTGSLFSVSSFTYFSVERMGFVHRDVAGRAAWSNILFDLNGAGGGREFMIRDIYTAGFNKVINHGNTINEDTNRIDRITSWDCKTFLYSRNSQSIGNLISQMTVYGTVDRVFDLSGYGHMQVDTATIIQSGTFLYLANGAAGLSSQYLINNAKFEFWPQGGPIGTSKIIETPDNFDAQAYVKFVNIGMSGGTPDPTIYQIDIKSGLINIEFDGGNLTGCKISTKSFTSQDGFNTGRILFRNMAGPPSTTLNRIAGVGGAAQMDVIFQNCKGIPNLCIKGSGASNQFPSSGGGGLDRNLNTKNSQGRVVSSNVTATHSFTHFGQRALVDRIRTIVSNKAGLTSCTVTAYKDVGLTQVIGSVAVPDGTSSTPAVYDITIPANTVITDGVYVTVTNTNVNGFADGSIFVDTTSF